MNRKKYNQLRAVIALFVGMVVAMATVRDSYVLAVTAVITGMIFMVLVRTKAKISVDEREVAIQEKAARMTYAIFAPTIGIGAFLMLMPSNSGLSIFPEGDIHLQSLGTVFAYLTLFLIAIYSLSYHFFNKKYGGGNEE